MDKELIQVGIKALREPNGDFLPATPIFMVVTPKLAARKIVVIDEIEKVEAYYLKEYIDALKRTARGGGKSCLNH